MIKSFNQYLEIENKVHLFYFNIHILVPNNLLPVPHNIKVSLN